MRERSQTELFRRKAAKILLKLISAGADFGLPTQFINQYSEFEASEIAQAILNGLNYEEKVPELLTHKKVAFIISINLEEEKLMSFQFEKAVPEKSSCPLFYNQKPFVLTIQDNESYANLKSGEKLVDFKINSIDYLSSGFF